MELNASVIPNESWIILYSFFVVVTGHIIRSIDISSVYMLNFDDMIFGNSYVIIKMAYFVAQEIHT